MYDDVIASKIAGDDSNALLGETVRIQTKEKSPSGERFFESVISPMRNSSSRIVGTIGVSRDITERHKAEVEYRESEERFRQVAENMESGLWPRDPREEEALYANQAHSKIWGTPNSAGRIALIHPDDRGRQVARTREQLEGHEVEPETEFRIVRAGGDVRWIECRTFPIRNEQGDVYRYAGTVNDLTDRRDVERAAARLAHENDVLAEIGRIITSSLNIDEVYERFAEQVARLIPFDKIAIHIAEKERDVLHAPYNYDRNMDKTFAEGDRSFQGSICEEIHRRGSGLLTVPLTREELARSFPSGLRTYDQGFLSSIRVSLVAKDDGIGVLHLTSAKPAAFTEEDLALAQRVANQISGAVANARLYTERILVEQAASRLAHENDVLAEIGRIITSSLNIDEVYERFAERVQVLIPSDKIDIVTIDLNREEMRVEYVHGIDVDAATAQRGFTRPLAGSVVEEVVRRQTCILSVPRDREELEHEFPLGVPSYDLGFRSLILVPLLSRGEGIGMLALLKRSDRGYSERDLSLAERVGSQISGAIANARLCEERVRIQERLLQSQKMEAVGQLAGGIAHNFNNLLTAIMSYSYLTENQLPEQHRARSGFQQIQEAAQRGGTLTHQLLAFSRRQVVQPKIFSLRELALDMDAMLRRLIGANIELVTLPGNDAGYVNADHGQIEQVVINLALNARDAMSRGGRLTIEIAWVALGLKWLDGQADAVPGDYILLSVRDTGAGMTEQVKQRVFDPFFTTKEVDKGTGLGLSSCHGIVAQHGGHIAVESKPGEGTTFNIYLPAADEPAITSEANDPVQHLPMGSQTVLLVDDEPLVRKMAAGVLRSHGYTVLEAGNGVEALEVSGRHTGEEIHLLLTDVVMPLMSGGELADRLRTDRPNIKVLLMSGYRADLNTQQGVSKEASKFLPKPFGPQDLVRRAQKVLA